MQPKQNTRNETTRVVGYAATIDKETAHEQIGALWAKAATGGLLGSSPTYGVYTDYEDRLAERYRVLVGVESEAEPAPDQEVVHLPAGRYAVFEAEGPPAEVAPSLWRHVWTRWKGDRAFVTDWERYEGGPDAAKVALFVGLG